MNDLVVIRSVAGPIEVAQRLARLSSAKPRSF
jgi:hypothetical protein